jgi:surfeit locus 1 family protein
MAARDGQYGLAATAKASAASRRAVAVWGGLLLTVLIPAFVSLGLWQWRKNDTKLQLQAELDARSRGAPVAMPTTPATAAELRYRHVVLRGVFEPERQILLDNRVYREEAGYHVLTPLKLDGAEMRVWVNRGWVPAGSDHKHPPEVAPPIGNLELTGIAVVPPARFFTLGPAEQPNGKWQTVWQNPDLERLRAAVPWPMQPVLVQLDADAPGGYAREWPRPDERADRHLSYALQWFGFAIASVGIWLYFLVRRQ